jgi:hypothetical protein
VSPNLRASRSSSGASPSDTITPGETPAASISASREASSAAAEPPPPHDQTAFIAAVGNGGYETTTYPSLRSRRAAGSAAVNVSQAFSSSSRKLGVTERCIHDRSADSEPITSTTFLRESF